MNRADTGQTTPFIVITVVALLAGAGLLLDGGLAVVAQIRMIGVADEAARAGAQQLDLTAYRRTGEVRLDTGRAARAAHRFLATNSLEGTVTVAGNDVHVIAYTSVSTQFLQLAGLNTLRVHASGDARPVRGITGPGR